MPSDEFPNRDPEEIQQYAGALLAFIKSQVRNLHDAEDILHDVFTKAIPSVDQCRGPLKPWLFGIARRCVIDAFRSKKFKEEPIHLNEVARRYEAVHQTVEDANEYLDAALATLPEEQREVLLLRYFGGLTVEEAAEMLGISYTSCTTRTCRALQALRTLLASERGTPA